MIRRLRHALHVHSWRQVGIALAYGVTPGRQCRSCDELRIP